MQRGRPTIPADDQRRIRRMAEVSRPKSEIARVIGISRPTAYKYARQCEQQLYSQAMESSGGDDSDDEEKNF